MSGPAPADWEVLPKERRWIVVAAVARVMRRQSTITADDLHAELPAHEYPWDRRAFGAVLRGLVQRGLLEAIGPHRSDRGVCHARPILVFRERPKLAPAPPIAVVASDQACGHCGEGMGFGWVRRLVACYPCFRDAERGGEPVSMEPPA